MNASVDQNSVSPPEVNLKMDGRVLQKSPLRLVRGIAPDPNALQPFLSIVICAYRHADYIEQCLESINSTAMQQLELLIIDDGSPDKTLRKCLDYPFQRGFNVRVYTKQNLGLVHSLRSGLELARGRYIAFMASDDCYVEDGLSSTLNFLQANPSVDALLCQAVKLGLQEGLLVYGDRMEALFKASPFERLDVIWTEPPRPMLLQATIFKTNFLCGLKPWTDNLELDDWPTFIRIFVAEAQHAAIVRYMPELKLCKYRVHTEGMHTDLDRQLRITSQVATGFVPLKYRSICLANARINNGLSRLHQGQWRKGLIICLQGFLTNPSLLIVTSILRRVWQFTIRRSFLARSQS